eukprot:scaffold64871_cov64-Phaeocystis_antarctica.AAC.2
MRTAPAPSSAASEGPGATERMQLLRMAAAAADTNAWLGSRGTGRRISAGRARGEKCAYRPSAEGVLLHGRDRPGRNTCIFPSVIISLLVTTSLSHTTVYWLLQSVLTPASSLPAPRTVPGTGTRPTGSPSPAWRAASAHRRRR